MAENKIGGGNKITFINREALKLLAMFFMLLDHMWATVIPGNQWMTNVGRMAFPIFAFQIAEGFIHTSDFKKYSLRLFVFALVSEIPFNLFYGSSYIYPFHQNVMFTLLLGLLAIKAISKFQIDKTAKNGIIAVAGSAGAVLLGAVGFVDYGAMGVMTVILFYLFRGFPFAWLAQLAGMFILNIYFFDGMFVPIEIFGRTFEFQTQGFALLALIPIHLYNGQKGRGGKIFKYSMYIFYPVHMLVLYLIFINM